MFAAIVLAAGSGRRFGGDKLFALLDGVAVVRRAAERVAAARPHELIVVVRPDDIARMEEALAGLRVRLVPNTNATHGMSTSITAGVRAVSAECESVLIALGDQPGVDPQVVAALVAALEDGSAVIAVPRYRGTLANPVLFGRSAFAELAALEGDVGARQVVERDVLRVRVVEVDAPVPADIDVPDDLTRGAG
jgi:molybdenum cofactor cytidylyltransferase